MVTRFVLVSFGVYVAGSLSLAHGIRDAIPCLFAGGGCSLFDAAKPESLLFGVPVAFIGLAGYIAIAISTITEARCREAVRTWAFGTGYILSVVGAVVSLRLMFVQVFQTQAVCIWCLVSCVVMLLMLLTYGLDAARETPHSQPTTCTSSKLLTLFACAVPLIAVTIKTVAWRDPPMITIGSKSLNDVDTTLLLGGDPLSLGANEGQRTFVLFFNPLCGPCEEELHELLTLKSRDPETRILIRHKPSGPVSEYAAFVSEIAREQGRFFAFLTTCYRNPPRTREEIERNALRVGIDLVQVRLRADNLSDRAWKSIDFDKQLATRLGLRFTPATIIVEDNMSPRYALRADPGAGGASGR